MPLRPLSYDDRIDLPEAQERLREVYREFDAIRRKYTTGIRQLQWWMSREDRGRLTDAMGVLLPLTMQPSVQEEFHAKGYCSEGTVYSRSMLVFMQASDMLADYWGTGVRRLHSQPIWEDTIPGFPESV